MTDLAAPLRQTGNAHHVAVVCGACGRSAIVTDWRHLRMTGWTVTHFWRLEAKLVEERVADGPNVCDRCAKIAQDAMGA